MSDIKRKYGFLSLIKSDAVRWNENMNILNFLAILLFQPGFQLSFSLRLQQALCAIPVLGSLLRKVVWYFTCILLGCHCSSRATYGRGLHFPHPIGIVIGDGVQIGDNVTVYHGTTIGLKDFGKDAYPILEDDVIIYAGAQVLGSVTISKKSIVGANAVVLKNVPEGAAAVGIPARIIEKISHIKKV
ncbi:MAG: serine O-acetyltransferase [Alphaproteobacteria bacterium CG_4_9_14_3_um_filter_47_13]|nr:MAG: serine O-acetyltransferase [Alphaproteobacteria bacterium CG_4_9_14_3_um_filter_47_13]